MANTKEGTVQIAGAGTSPAANQKLYDDWAHKYEQDVRSWGYTMPEVCAEALKKYAPAEHESTYKVLDAGAGDGLSGKAIVGQGFKEVVGVDLSPELINIANKNGVYKKAEVADLSMPLKYQTDEFDAMTVVGVMTYLEPDGCSLDEFCRVVKPGGLVIMTHRSDKVNMWNDKHAQLIKDGKWEKVEVSDPYPYLPNNPEYGDKIKVIVHVFRVSNNRPFLQGNKSLAEVDPVMAALVEEEKARQLRSIELIASENFTSRAVMECLGSALTNKYSEGQPGGRYYGGNEVIDKIENLCKDRALQAFDLDSKEWGVNVQPYSGSPANFAVYTALLPPHSRMMGLDLPSGGHLTHGYYTAKKRISASSIYFETLPYKVHAETGLIDFEDLRKQALVFRPAMILCGASAYPRVIDFAKFRSIADEVGALLMADIAHISGLVATGQHAAPFEFCDVVTTTTHKSLRGPRAGMIFYKYTDRIPDIKERIDMAVFPGLQGGPHNHQIGALAAQLLEVKSLAFTEYSKTVVANAKTLAEELRLKGHKLASDGTDNHLVLWDLRPHGLTGSKVEKVCELASISLNRNAVHGDASALSPGGVRIGTPAMTTRGCTSQDFKKIAGFLDRCCQIALKIQAAKGKKLKDFEAALPADPDIKQLKSEVEAWAVTFGYPGI